MIRLLLAVGLAGLLSACAGMSSGGGGGGVATGSDTATMGASPGMMTRSPHGTGGPVGVNPGGSS